MKGRDAPDGQFYDPYLMWVGAGTNLSDAALKRTNNWNVPDGGVAGDYYWTLYAKKQADRPMDPNWDSRTDWQKSVDTIYVPGIGTPITEGMQPTSKGEPTLESWDRNYAKTSGAARVHRDTSGYLHDLRTRPRYEFDQRAKAIEQYTENEGNMDTPRPAVSRPNRDAMRHAPDIVTQARINWRPPRPVLRPFTPRSS